MKDADYWLEQVEKSLDNEPDQTALERLREELERIQSDLGRRQEAWRERRKNANTIASIEESAAQVKDQWQRQLDQAFINRYEEFDKQLTQIERDRTFQPAEQQTSRSTITGRSLRKWRADSCACHARLGHANQHAR